MNIADFITELYCKIDDALPEFARYSQAILSISELFTIGVLQAMKDDSRRAFYHWLKDNDGHLFPNFRTAPACSTVSKPKPAGPATFQLGSRTRWISTQGPAGVRQR